MLELTPYEARALGVLVEKAQTTPQQYPLTLNALTAGCNQKTNREPVLELTEDQVETALRGLRQKGLAREVMLTGSRVEKFRHVARETLDIDTRELVILSELLLRGPQTLGELRMHASRMHALESTDVVKNILDALISRPAPLARELPPSPGDRATRYTQLLCHDAHSTDAVHSMRPDVPAESDAAQSLLLRIETLERDVAQIKHVIAQLGA